MCLWRPTQQGPISKNDAVRDVEYLCHRGSSMLLNFCRSCSIMLVQTCPLHDEKPRTVKQRFPWQGDVHFVFSFFQSGKSFLFLSRRQDWLIVSASYMLCLHTLLATIYSRCQVCFIPGRSHCCTEGIFFLFREMLMYKLTFCVYQHKHQASRYCSPVDFEIWVLICLPVCLDK